MTTANTEPKVTFLERMEEAARHGKGPLAEKRAGEEQKEQRQPGIVMMWGDGADSPVTVSVRANSSRPERERAQERGRVNERGPGTVDTSVLFNTKQEIGLVFYLDTGGASHEYGETPDRLYWKVVGQPRNSNREGVFVSTLSEEELEAVKAGELKAVALESLDLHNSTRKILDARAEGALQRGDPADRWGLGAARVLAR